MSLQLSEEPPSQLAVTKSSGILINYTSTYVYIDSMEKLNDERNFSEIEKLKAIFKEKDEYTTGKEYAILFYMLTWWGVIVAEEELKSLQQEKEENLQMIASMSSYTIHVCWMWTALEEELLLYKKLSEDRLRETEQLQMKIKNRDFINGALISTTIQFFTNFIFCSWKSRRKLLAPE